MTPVLGDTLATLLLPKLGISPDMVSRVILDMQVSEPVRVYVEMYGSKDLLSINWPAFDGAEVITLKPREL